MKDKMRYADLIPSPLGSIYAVVDAEGALVQLDFEGGRSAPRDREDLEQTLRKRGLELEWSERALAHVRKALARYFAGDRRALALAAAPEGSEFQKEVWKELEKIPYGQTISYGELARRVGKPNASRAVGRANGTNPVSLVIPCHRVVGSDGSLTGYGGGMERKRALLDHEAGSLLPLV